MKRKLLLLLLLWCLISISYSVFAQTNYINATGYIGLGNASPTNYLQIGSGTGSLHTGGANGILFKSGSGDRSLFELHSPDGLNRVVFQSLGQAYYLASLEQKPLLMQTEGGKIAIGTHYPDANATLTVKGSIASREVNVFTAAGADFVFEPDYKLPSLNEIERYVKQNKHLPDVPAAKEMIAKGVDLGTLNITLLQKVEELTLYLIEKDKQLFSQQQQIDALKAEMRNLQHKNN
jgi:hypothetical protein